MVLPSGLAGHLAVCPPAPSRSFLLDNGTLLPSNVRSPLVLRAICNKAVLFRCEGLITVAEPGIYRVYTQTAQNGRESLRPALAHDTKETRLDQR